MPEPRGTGDAARLGQNLSMGKVYDGIDVRLARFLTAQPVFFVGTAPLEADGHVNCSPKGNEGSFVVLGERRVAYRDLTGSGVETIAHLRQNGRIVVMFCAFTGPPRIVRLHGRGSVLVPGDPSFDDLLGQFAPNDGTRAIIAVDVERVSDSCGYAVPLMTFDSHRRNLDHWADSKGHRGLVDYRAQKNARSIDGLDGLPVAERGAGEASGPAPE